MSRGKNKKLNSENQTNTQPSKELTYTTKRTKANEIARDYNTDRSKAKKNNLLEPEQKLRPFQCSHFVHDRVEHIVPMMLYRFVTYNHTIKENRLKQVYGQLITPTNNRTKIHVPCSDLNFHT